MAKKPVRDEPAPAKRAEHASSAGEEVATGAEVTESDAASADAQPSAPADPGTQTESPDDELRRKFREAMAAKHGAHGAEKSEHADHAQSGHGTNTGPGHRMFRRKAGS